MAEDAKSTHAIEQLMLESLAELAHGKVGIAFNRELKRLGRDCIDRPGDDRARTVTLTVNVKPKPLIDGQSVTCEGATAVAKVKARMPDYETQEIDLGIRENGATVFSPTCPENHQQSCMFKEPEEEK